MEFKDYYAILGVTPQTPHDEMKRAYRKLARQYHPDVSKLPDAESKFKEINEAWEVLQDKDKRAQYDQIREGGFRQQDFRGAKGGYEQTQEYSPEQAAAFNDFFQSIFGGRQDDFDFGGQAHHRHYKSKGRDFHIKLALPLTTAYNGGVETLQLQMPTTNEQGQTQLQNKSLQVKIPAGVLSGNQIRLKDQGGKGVGGGPNGDLYIEMDIMPHPYFSLHQKDIHLTLPITPWEAALGASIVVPTLGGNVNVKIPPNSQSGKKMRLKGRGMPGEPPGDQYLIFEVQVPSANTEQSKALYEQMEKEMPFNPRIGLGV
ncbi:MAG: DnaJ domain-containing protein [Proteobacteria bacterium]|nr:DnaJ domain-containing protein [Pseudomonadota bacterium]